MLILGGERHERWLIKAESLALKSQGHCFSFEHNVQKGGIAVFSFRLLLFWQIVLAYNTAIQNMMQKISSHQSHWLSPDQYFLEGTGVATK